MLAKSSVIKLAVEHVSRRVRQLVQFLLVARTLMIAVVISSVVGVMADSDVCSGVWYCNCHSVECRKV